MHRVMTELHQDHVHLTRLLDLLDEQVLLMAADGDPDFPLMIDIAHFIQSYPDLVHHPKEDLVFRVFKNRSNKGADVVDTLLDEHQSLPAITVDFLALLEGVVSGYSIIDRDELKQKIQHFIDIQREHMEKEEKTIFPLIEKTLNEQDWADIENALKTIDDPLSGKRLGADVEACYDNLYQLIKSESK